MLEPDPEDVRAVFDRLAPAYDRFNLLASLGMHSRWRRRTVGGIRPGQSVLDIGCGTGDLALAAWERTGGAGRVTGVDFVDSMLELARAKAAREGAGGVSFARGSADALPFPDGEFDVVVSAFVLRSLAAVRSAAVAEIRRVLKPGGVACILELTRPAPALLRMLHRWYLKAAVPLIGLAAAGRHWPRGYLVRTVLDFPEPDAYGEWFTSSGFGLVECERLSGGLASLLVLRRTP